MDTGMLELELDKLEKRGINRYKAVLMAAQEARFINVLDELGSNGIHPQWVHASNSAAALVRPNDRFNLVRAGISIYGLHPSADVMLPNGFEPALS